MQTGGIPSAPTVLAPAPYDDSSSEAGGRAARQAQEDGFWDRPVKQHHAEDHIPTILQRCGSPQAPACQMGPHKWITQPGGIPPCNTHIAGIWQELFSHVSYNSICCMPVGWPMFRLCIHCAEGGCH